MTAQKLTKPQARRITVRAQLLASADLVSWSRLGSTYEPEHLKQVRAVQAEVDDLASWLGLDAVAR